METKRVNLNDETRRVDVSGDTRRVDNDVTRKVDNDSTNKVDTTQSGSTGLVVFGTGQPLELNGKNCTVENVISMSSGEAIIYKITMDGKPYVLKHYKINTPLTDSALKVLNKLKGNPKENVIHQYDFGKLNDQDYELMELAEGGTLNQYIKSLGAVKDFNKLKTIVKMIIDGLMQMHGEYRIIHQDIKPDNIYFRDIKNSSLMLADFGISSVMTGDETKVVANKTPLYAAPELTPEGDSIFVNVTPSIDYYALGITMLELWLGEKPFKGMPAAKRDDIILKELVEFPADMSEDTKIIIQGLIKPYKKDRWGKIELDKWLKGEKLVAGQKAARFVYETIKVGNETASNPEELAVLFEKYPDKASECLYGGMLKSGTIKPWLEKSGDKKLLTEIEKIISQYSKNKETGRFLAMYTLNPGHPFKTKSGKVCKTSEEIAGALLSESAFYMEELKKPDAHFYLYLGVTEGVQGKKAAYDFCEYFKKYKPIRALNHVYLKLQEEGSITIGKKKYYKGEEMAEEKDSSQIVLIKKALNETESPLLVWLSDMYPDFMHEAGRFTDLLVGSQFFIFGLLPFLSYKELIPDWNKQALSDLKTLLSGMPGRSDLFEAYAKQGLPLKGHLPDDRGSTPIDYLIYNSKDLIKQYGEKIILNIVSLLLKLGADPNEKSKDGKGVRDNLYYGRVDSYKLSELLKEKIPDITDVKDILDNETSIERKIDVLIINKRYDEALPLVKSQAEKSSVYGMAVMGLFYYNGYGIQIDFTKAAEWFGKAAEKGNALSQFHLGLCYMSGKGVPQNNEKSAEWFNKAAEYGHAGAQYMLGLFYSLGKRVTQDYKKAFEWFQKAAEQGDEDAIIALGDCYYFGDGVTQNYTKAVECYNKSTKRDNADGMYNLGNCYQNGEGIQQDYAKAVECFTTSALCGNDDAMYCLGNCYYYGEGVTQDYEKAVEWYLKSAQKDNNYAMYLLGDCYYDGFGVDQDYTKAAEWYDKSAQSGSKYGMYKLGNCYYEGKGVKQDDTKAFEWLSKSAERGYKEAQSMLGDMYNEGQGVKQNKVKAIEWYKKAAEQDHEGAVEMLKELGEISRFTGRKKVTLDNGSVYEGDFVNDKRTGKGKYVYSDGGVYEGNFQDDKFMGKGKRTYSSGDVYEGDFINSLFHGVGKYTWKDGTIHDGGWFEGKKHGKAKVTHSDGRVYIGDYADGKRNGKGKMTYPDGRVEEGNWKDGEFAGK